MRPLGRAVGLQRGCQPSRLLSLSAMSFFSLSIRSPFPGGFDSVIRCSRPRSISFSKSMGFRWMTPCQLQTGQPSPLKSSEIR